MPIHHLRAIGSIDFPAEESQEADDFIERRAMLVYAGQFESAEGPVTVTNDQIKNLVTNHNSNLSKLKRLISGKTPLRHYPPVQLDHSTSARDTVGRLVGDVLEGEFAMEDGHNVPAVFGTLRILGKENVERVKDGRWTDLSLGADFERGMIAELTITPFPAAVGSAMLSAKKRSEVYCDYPNGTIKVTVDLDEATGKYHAAIDGKEVGDGFVTKETAVEAAQKVVQEKIAPVPGADESGDTMDTQRLKGYLVGFKKMVEKDADDHLVKLSKPEHSDDLKKLIAEESAWDKTEKDARVAKLTAAREGITKLSTEFKTSVDKAKLEAAQGRIVSRLSKLRADGKVTPAEIKKMDITALSARTQNEIDLIMKTYDNREPMVMTGQVGTTKGSALSQLADKDKAKSRLEAETRANMSLLAKSGAKTQLSNEHTESVGRTEEQAPPPVVEDKDKDNMSYFEAEYGEMSRLFGEGKHDEAKSRLKAYMSKHLASGGMQSGTDCLSADSEKHLSALAENVATMQAKFDELIKLSQDLAT